MEKLKLYIVTQGSTDKTFKTGDLIWMSENGDINNAMGCGWLRPNEQNPETMDFKIEESNTHHLVIKNGQEYISVNNSPLNI